VPRHVEFAVDDAEDLAVRSDDKGGALARQGAEALHAKQLGDLAVGIREKWEAEVIFLIEGLLPIHRIGADPHALGTEFRELAGQIAKVTAFNRSTRRHGLGIEEEDEGAVLEKAAQPDCLPVLVR